MSDLFLTRVVAAPACGQWCAWRHERRVDRPLTSGLWRPKQREHSVGRQVFHAYAIWDGWAFDHSGWNPEPELLAVNTDFEGHPVESAKITDSLAEFCEKHHSRMPNQYWDDPLPRARNYVSRYTPPWA